MRFPVSPYQKCGGLYYFPRMIDKIRLHARGELPADYVALLEGGYNRWLCEFLGVTYADLVKAVVEGNLSDDAALEWCYAQRGKALSELEIKMWNAFSAKRGWRDERHESLQASITESGLAGRGIETNFDYFVAEEGREPHTGAL